MFASNQCTWNEIGQKYSNYEKMGANPSGKVLRAKFLKVICWAKFCS